MSTFTDPKNIDELLVRSGMISTENLNSLQALASKMRLPIGRVLCMQGFLTEEKFLGVEHIQKILLDGIITQEEALKALELMARNNFTAETALGRVAEHLALTGIVGTTPSKLGQLMCESEIISPKQLEAGMRLGRESGLPLGRVLVASKVISEGVLKSSLSAQRLVADEKIPRDKAKLALRFSRLNGTSFEFALASNQIPYDSADFAIGVPDLLAFSALLTDVQLSTARELAIVEERDVLEVIKDSGLVNADIIAAAPQLVQYVVDQQLMPEQAAHALRRMRSEPIEEVMVSLDYAGDEDLAGIDLPDFLRESGLVSAEELEVATQEALASRMPLARKLLEAGLTDETTVGLASECKSMVDNGIIHLEQAKIALCYALENELNLADTLRRFGWLPYVYEGERRQQAAGQ